MEQVKTRGGGKRGGQGEALYGSTAGSVACRYRALIEAWAETSPCMITIPAVAITASIITSGAFFRVLPPVLASRLIESGEKKHRRKRRGEKKVDDAVTAALVPGPADVLFMRGAYSYLEQGRVMEWEEEVLDSEQHHGRMGARYKKVVLTSQGR